MVYAHAYTPYIYGNMLFFRLVLIKTLSALQDCKCPLLKYFSVCGTMRP